MRSKIGTYTKTTDIIMGECNIILKRTGANERKRKNNELADVEKSAEKRIKIVP